MYFYFDSHSEFLLQIVYKQQSLFKEGSENKGMNERKELGGS